MGQNWAEGGMGVWRLWQKVDPVAMVRAGSYPVHQQPFYPFLPLDLFLFQKGSQFIFFKAQSSHKTEGMLRWVSGLLFLAKYNTLMF